MLHYVRAIASIEHRKRDSNRENYVFTKRVRFNLSRWNLTFF